MGDGQHPIENRHHTLPRLGRGVPLLLGNDGLNDALEHGLERVDALDLGHRRAVERQRACRVEHAVADITEICSNPGDFVEERLGRERAGDLELPGRLGERFGQAGEPFVHRRQAFPQVVSVQRHEMNRF